MSICGRFPDGFYDKDGIWQRTKFCFVYCGPERCTCQPPFGQHRLDPASEYNEPRPVLQEVPQEPSDRDPADEQPEPATSPPGRPADWDPYWVET